MASLEQLNAYLESNSYLGGSAAASHDYELCEQIGEQEIDAARLPHLER